MIIPPPYIVGAFKDTPGAMSVCECIAVYNLALSVPDAQESSVGVVLGSHAGKDAIPASVGLKLRGHTTVVLVDPCYDLANARAWAQSCQGEASKMPWPYVREPDFNDKVRQRIVTATDGRLRASLYGEASMDALPKIVNQGWSISYCMVDSDDHDYQLIKRETDFLKEHMETDGVVVLHDFGNYTSPVIIYDEMLAGGGWAKVEIPWEDIRAYVGENDLEKGNSSWHTPEIALPCFVGALRRVR